MALSGPVAHLPVLGKSGNAMNSARNRRWLCRLAAAVLPMLVLAPATVAQTSSPTCIATADSSPSIPAASADFGVSDVTVNCSGGNSGETITFSLRVNVSVPVSGLTATIDTSAGSFQGLRTTSNGISWASVTLPPPGGDGLRTFKISGVRINAAQAAAGTVLIFLEVTGTPSISITNPTIGVGNVSAPASPLTCSVSAGDPPQYSASLLDAGVAEMTIQCTGGQASTPAVINFQVYVSTNVTSPTATISMDTSTYQGSRIAANSLSWPAVPVTQPGPGGSLVLRMSGIRINPSLAVSGQVVANITASSLSSVVMTSSQAVVALVGGAPTAPQITAINPVTPIATGLRTITFTGINLSPGLTVTMNRPDGTAMPAGLFAVVNVLPTSLSVSVDFGGVTGTYSISVKNPDGQSSLAFSFSVVLDSGPATRVGAMAHFASGGGWKTTIRLLNVGRSPASVRITLVNSDGSLAQLPLVITQAGVAVSLSGAVVDRTILANGSLQVETEAAVSDTAVGWVEIRGSAPVTGFGIFRQRHEDGAESEGTSPLDARTSQNVIVPFDNQSNYSTGVAIANLSSASSSTVTAIFRDDLGRESFRDAFVIPANGHTAFSLPARWPSLSGRQGSVEFQGNVAAGLAALGFRFNPSLNFTSLPVSAPEPAQ